VSNIKRVLIHSQFPRCFLVLKDKASVIPQGIYLCLQYLQCTVWNPRHALQNLNGLDRKWPSAADFISLAKGVLPCFGEKSYPVMTKDGGGGEFPGGS
jgi:hypothetical protein